jgi:5-formyltetrahydrofolate cyclo-ligase
MDASSVQTADKPALRRRYRVSRRERAGDDGARARLSSHLGRLIDELGFEQVALYRPMAEEAGFDLGPVERFFYPRLNGKNLEFFRPETAESFTPGPFGIEEPRPEASVPLDPARPVLVCCPAVAVDWQGTRLGMGGGHYDRFFSDHPDATRAAVVFQVQVSSEPLPAESWDSPLDWIVSEEMILRTSSKRSS